jgi:hypothetical protein
MHIRSYYDPYAEKILLTSSHHAPLLSSFLLQVVRSNQSNQSRIIKNHVVVGRIVARIFVHMLYVCIICTRRLVYPLLEHFVKFAS